MRDCPILWLVIPCYNEEAMLPFAQRLFGEKLSTLIGSHTISDRSKILFVIDGSTDNTWDIIQQYSNENAIFQGISLSRNMGHQNALLGGLQEAAKYCDVTISVDCDGQDDINCIDQMLEKYKAGYEVVYGVRKDRSSDTFFKRGTAQLYYKLLLKMGVDIVYNHADYRLLSKKFLSSFNDFHEVNLYLRGLVPLVGFKSTVVSYERKKRIAGESHYPLRKMVHLAIDGITSLSVAPLHLITIFGLIIAFVSFGGVILTIIRALMGGTVPGWASMTCIVCFVSGVQLVSLGIIGEYIGKIYLETKHRPRYIIDKKTYENDEE